MPHELSKAYDPAVIEERWAAYWVSENLFAAQTPASDAAPAAHHFTMLLPPPNVTGRLHMGHMLNQTEMDILTRWHRMRGERTLWVPGTDHAGIATQMMVERQLAGEGKTRQDLGRDAFVERVWQWRGIYGGAILDQMRRLGASVDWPREYFTMDENLSVAVREAFVRLWEQGLIYRGAYIVNWCPRCGTAISDLEVVHEEQAGKLYALPYALESGGFVSVATTRPETLFGDVALAVHPDDDRYRHLHGRSVTVPFTDRKIPILTDAWVTPEFGTGVVKITPAHDANDFALGQRHNLTPIVAIDETAHLTEAAGHYAGLDRYVARRRLVEDFEAQYGPAFSFKEHSNSVGKCDRCKTVVEPRLSLQWFIKIQPLADKAIAAVDQGLIAFTPDQYRKSFDEWMKNIHDWCISRQLWWGHRIPAWHCGRCREIVVARETPTECTRCGSAELTQETDVLDTWFSSGLLPMSVFGWPAQTAGLAAFYPTDLLVTGFDILFFWVARMIMLGCHFMLDIPMPDGGPRTLADAVPFRNVYIHALVRDADRQKMSKTKGNVIDPIEIVARYGTDAVRFTLASMASPGTDIAFSEARTEGYRAFANKIWNAARFVFMQVERAKEAGISAVSASLHAEPEPAPDAPLEDRWILSRLNSTAGEVNRALRDYRFDVAADLVYAFFWGDLCDWYLEASKLRVDFSPAADAPAARAALLTLVSVFEAALRLLSPFMPFLTEELWHALFDGKPPAQSIAFTRFPQGDPQHLDWEAEEQMAYLQELIVEVRAARKDRGVPEREKVPVRIAPAAALVPVIQSNALLLERLAQVSQHHLEPAPLESSDGSPVRSTPHFDLSIDYQKPVDLAVERERLTRDLAKLEKELANGDRQLGNEAFLAKAPAAVVEGLRRRNAELAALVPKTRAALESLGADSRQPA